MHSNCKNLLSWPAQESVLVPGGEPSPPRRSWDITADQLNQRMSSITAPEIT